MKHGTISGYKLHKCRCDECRAANNKVAAAYRKTRIKPQKSVMVDYETWFPVINQYIARKKNWSAIEELTGIFSFTISGAYRKKSAIQVRTYEKLMAGLEKLQAEAEQEKIDKSEAKVFQRRWEETFRFLYRGGFTKYTLAERLDIKVERLERFIDSDYKEDPMLAMRIAQLRWVMIQGEAKEDGQSEHERIDGMA